LSEEKKTCDTIVYPVYIKAERHTQIRSSKVKIGQVAQVYCSRSDICRYIEDIQLCRVNPNNKQKFSVSVMALIQAIDQNCPWPVVVENMGESEFLISVKADAPKKGTVGIKVALVTLITFFGSIFAIMTYNEDVDVTGVFDKIYTVVEGEARDTPGILEAAYGVGVALGIIIFFNHFGRYKLTKDPTPMEIEMEKYEADIEDTFVKEQGRKNAMMEKWHTPDPVSGYAPAPMSGHMPDQEGEKDEGR